MTYFNKFNYYKSLKDLYDDIQICFKLIQTRFSFSSYNKLNSLAQYLNVRHFGSIIVQNCRVQHH